MLVLSNQNLKAFNFKQRKAANQAFKRLESLNVRHSCRINDYSVTKIVVY